MAALDLLIDAEHGQAANLYLVADLPALAKQKARAMDFLKAAE